MKIHQPSKAANLELIEYLDKYLVNSPRSFRDDVLYAIRLTAPLRERTYLLRIAADMAEVGWSVVEPFALAAEFFIISALTADDVIDGADRRSGEPSLFKLKGPARSFLVAEWLHAMANICLSQKPSIADEARWREAAEEFRSAYSSLIMNQYVESDEQGNPDVTLKEIDKLAAGRTGGLLKVCLTVPAILAGLNDLEKSLDDCGRWLGIAFQHRDDILDFISAPEVLGKPILLDLLNGQPNLVLSHALTISTDKIAREIILKYFGAGLRDNNILEHGHDIQDDVLSAVRKSGSLAYASEVVRDYCARAQDALSGVPASRARDELHGFIDLVSNIEFPWENA